MLIGQRVAHYRITAAIGAGGMGQVYRATDTRLGRDVALKVLPPEMAGSRDRLERFQREARAVAALNHPHVVTIYSVEEAEGVHFLTMELVEGEPLSRLIPDGGMAVPRLLDIAAGLADALAAAHEKGIIHRDLKPANAMVTKDGRLKVLDFGLAKMNESVERSGPMTELPTDMQTREGVVVGTMPYMSPEQLQAEAVDHRTDIFSLGVMLYEMAGGERPFRGSSSANLVSAILRDTPRPLVERRKDLPEGLIRIITRCLEKSAADRFPSARDVVSALAAVTHPVIGPVPVEDVVHAEEGFWVAVLPFKYSGANTELTALSEGLTEDVVTGLSRFSYLRVISRSSTSRYVNESVDVRSAGKELGARYVMEGSLRQAGTRLRVAVRLVDAVSGAHLWAENFERTFSPEAVFELQDDLVPRIVSTVADMNGVLPRSMSETLHGRKPEQLSPYEAVLRSFGYLQAVTPEALGEARSGLELAVRKAPDYADAWAMLAFLSVQEYGQGFKLQADPLTSGAAAARRAVEAAPSNALAYFSLAEALFFQKEFESFRNAAERAVTLNPMDGNSIAFLGELLTYAGDSERGLALAGRAKQLNPHHPGWYWYADFYNAYRLGDYRGALSLVLKSDLPGHWGMQAAMAATYAQLGERDAAAKALRELLKLRPDFAASVRTDFEKWWEPAYVESFLDGLRKAGLDVPASAEADSAAKAEAAVAIAVMPLSDLSAAKEPEASRSGAAARTVFSALATRRWLLWIAAVSVLAVSAWLIIRNGALHPGTRAPHAAATPRVIRSIAVLPLDNYSGDPNQEYFVEGMTDELTADLATISQLRVISRGSAMQFKGSHRPPTPEIARVLNVDAVVEGSVTRVGDKVRITAQLIDARADRHLWARSFERSSGDVLALQGELASAIAHEINVQLTPTEQSRLAAAPRVDPQSHDAYLKGRYFFNRPSDDNLKKAIAQFEQAVQLNPRFAPAYSGLSDAYLWAGYNEGFLTASEARPKAKGAAETAVRLDDNSAEAHTSLAVFKLFYEYDWDGCEREFRRAIALNPGYAFAHDQFGMALAFQGRIDEAIAEGKRAAELDPLSPQILIDAAMAFLFRGDHEAVMNMARKAAELDPTFFFPPMLEGWADSEVGKAGDAVGAFTKASAMESPAFVVAFLAYAYGASGDRGRAMAELENLRKRSLRGQAAPFSLALVYLGLGDRPRTMDYLEKAYASDSQWMGWLKMDHVFDPLRSEPRFVALLRRLGFEQ